MLTNTLRSPGADSPPCCFAISLGVVCRLDPDNDHGQGLKTYWAWFIDLVDDLGRGLKSCNPNEILAPRNICVGCEPRAIDTRSDSSTAVYVALFR